MIGLSDYAKIKNNYCICYFGYSDEYLLQLKIARPYMTKLFPGLNIYIGCKDSTIHLFDDEDKILKLSELKIRKPEFAHIFELRYDGVDHPVEKFLVNSGVPRFPKPGVNIERPTNRCVIVTESTFPTKPLIDKQIDILKTKAREENMDPVVTNDIKGAGMVVGVESLALYQAAIKGLPTKLVPTGVGTRLYRKMIPEGLILEV